MIDSVYYILCIVLAGLVLLGISMMSKVKTALWGNLLSCACMAAAIVLTIVRYDFSGKWLWLLVGLVPAAIAGESISTFVTNAPSGMLWAFAISSGTAAP